MKILSYAKKGLLLGAMLGTLGFGISMHAYSFAPPCQWWCPQTGFGDSNAADCQRCAADAYIACGGPAFINC